MTATVVALAVRIREITLLELLVWLLLLLPGHSLSSRSIGVR